MIDGRFGRYPAQGMTWQQFTGGTCMYQKPVVQRFGSFREVTQAGTESGFGDTTGGIWRFLTSSPSTS